MLTLQNLNKLVYIIATITQNGETELEGGILKFKNHILSN